MISFPVSFAVEAVNGTFFGERSLLSNPVTSVTIDSRTAAAGSLYVPIIGQVFDGHRFISSAFENGALCTLSDRKLEESIPYILVSDTTLALQQLAESYLRQNRIPVIGITGSSGKTSTKEMLFAVLSQHFNAFKTPGNLNNQTGVPQAVFLLEKENNLAVLELGTNHPGEILSLARIVRPDICVITNIGVAHIEFFGSRENIFLGKTEMLEYMQPGGTVIVNGDDDYLCRLDGAVTFGLNDGNRFRAVNIRDHGLFGSEFDAVTDGHTIHISVPAPGLHMIYNALCAVAAGTTLGMQDDEIVAGVASYRPFAGRMEVKKNSRFVVLDDSYNANPSSMMASIDVLSKVEGRKVCILGDMLELGESSESFHSQVGKYAAEHGADLLLCVGTEAAAIQSGALSCPSCRSYYRKSVPELLDLLPDVLRTGDTILVKASHGMHLKQVADYLLNGFPSA